MSRELQEVCVRECVRFLEGMFESKISFFGEYLDYFVHRCHLHLWLLKTSNNTHFRHQRVLPPANTAELTDKNKEPVDSNDSVISIHNAE